jgi:transcriptional regulator with XRE-family HTH domain
MSKPVREYVLIPKEEYEALISPRKTGAVDAIAYGRTSLARDLLAARKAAALTQAELAKRLRISQSLVSQAEQGKVKVGERYVASVLKACRLPSNWAPKPPKPGVASPRESKLSAAKTVTLRVGPGNVWFVREPDVFAGRTSSGRHTTNARKRAKK